MCLYPRLVENPKYLPNKKNKGKPPLMVSEKLKYVPIGCGNCIECRKQKANGWRTRLFEENKIHKYKYFVTFTFNEENLTKLEKELQTDDANKIAKTAIRRYLERWRKKYDKSQKHWLITELGHQGTERVHLHGIIFSETPITKEEFEKIWAYGWVYIGDYCNNKTINYIIKYVTKIDNDHKGYIPIILSSAGIGRNYIDNSFNKWAHKYKEGETKEYYTLPNGQKGSMPIYYRNHFFNEDERELLWLEKMQKHTIWVNGIECTNIDTENGWRNYARVLEQAQKENKALGFGDNSNEWERKIYKARLKEINPNFANSTLQNKEK